ncbi:MAG: hypothetical protein LBS89_00445, partial [Zoogloeaceae bacterium]|nr:hypothetical protein [Zoogloeaceae bacterium]
MKNIALLFWIFLATLGGGGCDLLAVTPLEREDTTLNVEEMRSGSHVTLKISGLVWHSALGVSHIRKEEKTPSDLQIIVELVLAHAGLSGNFEEEIVLPDTVETVS